MDWIKKNYDQFALALLALALLGVAVKLITDVHGFGEKFSAALTSPSKSTKIPEVDKAPIDDARQRLEKPSGWTNHNHKGLLFTSEKYKDNLGRLVKLAESSFPDYLTGKEIPAAWLEKHNLSVTDPAVTTQDADGDGFLNADEWRESTDPLKKDSHPAYHTKLFLKQWIKVPFRLKFQSYNGELSKPEALDFQINTLDLRQPSEFLAVGATVANTKFKIVKFEFKEVLNPNIGEKEDVSELTLVNAESNEPVVLILNKVVDSPNQFGRFEYRWNKRVNEPGQIIDVPKLREFILPPLPDVKYKLIDVSESAGVIQPAQGEKITITPYPKR